MNPKIKLIDKQLINKIKYKKEDNKLLFGLFGKYDSVSQYTDEEISEMYYGIYKDRKILVSDDGEIVEMNKISSGCCKLSGITYIDSKDRKSNMNINISQVKAFKIEDYFLEESDIIGNIHQYKISELLSKLGALKKMKSEFGNYYCIQNSYKELQSFNKCLIPKDLYQPIKLYINGLFFNDHYYIDNFRIESRFIFDIK